MHNFIPVIWDGKSLCPHVINDETGEACGGKIIKTEKESDNYFGIYERCEKCGILWAESIINKRSITKLTVGCEMPIREDTGEV